ncbi:MAG: hypothetical protein M1812_000968 [Candelaria pacifica]|nr:MAG: hypothetical protein M1812_000968 [Candelaria pacifica]
MSRLLRIRRPFDPIAAAAEDSTVRFDEASGQVYTEVTVGGKIDADWAWRSRGSNRFSEYYHEQGTASLEATAMRSVLANIGSITAEALEYVPWHIARNIWAKIGRSGEPRELDSFHAWRAFATVYHKEGDSSLLYHRQSIIKPSIALEQYMKTVTSQEIDWITYLSISNVAFTRTELIKLSKLVNLGALDILGSTGLCRATSSVEDSVVRAWSTVAAEGGAFSKLRVLILRNHRDITPRSLEYLNCFPSLTLYKVSGCSISFLDDEEVKSSGWSCSSGKELLEALSRDKGMAHSWDTPIHACFRRAGNLKSGVSEVAEAERINSLPVLNFRIGPTAGEDLFTSLSHHAILCFQRQQPQIEEAPLDGGLKRKEQESETALSQAPKKRKMKVSKHQKFEELLKGFGGL